ncbi:hypothetical protein FB639_002924 [Coemansia asiatica]|nr:hypothetical protein FB639_002924 [Coemansia asiatica]
MATHTHTHAQMLSPPHTHTHQAQSQPQLSAAPPDLKPNFYNPYHVKHRRRTTKEQLSLLESTFKTTPKPTSEVRKSLALTLNMTAREVQIWFQNRRAKQKNMMLRASSATETSPGAADRDKLSAGPDALPNVDTSCSSAILSALLPASAKHMRATSADHAQPPQHAPRRHSDIPVSLLQPETASVTARRLVTAAPTIMAAATTSPTECTPPLSSGPQDSLQRLFAQPPASSSRPMQPNVQNHAHMQRKQKRAGAADSDRYHTARVHQEAFDGTNKLPLKPDDLSPRSVDEQFSLLDPSNLPTFMMPGASSNGALGAGFSSMGAAGFGGAHMPTLGISPQQSMSYGSTNMGVCWPSSLPYGAHQQQQQQQPLQSLSGQPASAMSQGVPPTDMSLLFSGLLGLGSTGSTSAGNVTGSSQYPGLSLNTLGLSGIASGGGPASAPVNSSMSPADLAFGSSDPTLALYQTLFLLGQRPPPQQQQQQGRGSSNGARGAGLAPAHTNNSNSNSNSNISPLSPPESIEMTSPGTSNSPSNKPATGVTLMSPPPIPGSAFAPYDAQPKQQQQHRQHRAMFMPTSVAYSHLVGASGINDASSILPTTTTTTTSDIFASTNTTSTSK